MPDQVFVTIGDFARMTQLTVKSLRHYHELSLLIPAEIDQFSGYRRYSADQVVTAQVIRRLRELDMPLPQIADVLTADSVEQRNAAIARHLALRERELARVSATVASLRELLGDPNDSPAAIHLEHAVAQTALAQRKDVTPESFAEWLPELTARLHRTAAGRSVGPPGALFDESFFADGHGVVTGYLPIAAPPLRAHADIETIELPPVDLAVITHRRHVVDIDRSYATLGRYVAERAIGVVGSIRERFPDAQSIETCWPVFRIT